MHWFALGDKLFNLDNVLNFEPGNTCFVQSVADTRIVVVGKNGSTTDVAFDSKEERDKAYLAIYARLDAYMIR